MAPSQNYILEKRLCHKIIFRKNGSFTKFLWLKIGPFTKFICIAFSEKEKKNVCYKRGHKKRCISNYGIYVVQENIINNKMNLLKLKMLHNLKKKKNRKIFLFSQKGVFKNKTWIDPCKIYVYILCPPKVKVQPVLTLSCFAHYS